MPAQPRHRQRYRRPALQAGVDETRRNGNLRGKPAVIVHGRADALLPVSHTSRPYAALNKKVEGAASKLSYVKWPTPSTSTASSARPPCCRVMTAATCRCIMYLNHAPTPCTTTSPGKACPPARWCARCHVAARRQRPGHRRQRAAAGHHARRRQRHCHHGGHHSIPTAGTLNDLCDPGPVHRRCMPRHSNAVIPGRSNEHCEELGEPCRPPCSGVDRWRWHWPWGRRPPRRPPAPVVVGQVAPLSGVLASTGAQMVLGGKIYFDWVNAQGGVHGASIRQAVADDGYKVADTVTRTRELAKPEVVALYGFAGTANITQLLADGVLEQGGAALVAPYRGRVAAQPVQPVIFHVRAGYADETEHMVQQLTTLGMNRVAVMYRTMVWQGARRGGGGAGQAWPQARGVCGLRAQYRQGGRRRQGHQGRRCARGHHDCGEQALGGVHPALPRAGRWRAALQHLGGGPDRAGQSSRARHGLGISQVGRTPPAATAVVREYQTLLKNTRPTQRSTTPASEQFLGAKVLVEALRRAGPAPTSRQGREGAGVTAKL